MSSPSWRSALSSAVDCWGSAPSFNLPYESLLRCTSVGHGRGAESSDRNWVLPALGDRASHRSVAGAGGIQCAHVGAAVPAHQRRARPPCPSSSSSPWVRALLHSTFDQPDAESVVANMIGCPCTIRRAAEGGRAPRWRPRSAADLRRLPQADLALDLVSQSRRMPQQGDPSPRRRRHFPDRSAIIRLVGAVFAEQHDKWIDGRRYLGPDGLNRSRVAVAAPAEQETTTTPALTA